LSRSGELLAELREAEGNPANGPILRGVKLSKDGKPKPLNLNALACAIRAALLNRENDRNGQAKDWKPLEWHGYYSLRRGIATHLNTISHDPMASQRAVAAFPRQHNPDSLHPGSARSDGERNGASRTTIQQARLWRASSPVG